MAKRTVTVVFEQEGELHASLIGVKPVPLDEAFLKAESKVRDEYARDSGYEKEPREVKLELARTSMKSTGFGYHREWTFEFDVELSD